MGSNEISFLGIDAKCGPLMWSYPHVFPGIGPGTLYIVPLKEISESQLTLRKSSFEDTNRPEGKGISKCFSFSNRSMGRSWVVECTT